MSIPQWYWLTRNRVGGVLSTLVVVWSREPGRCRFEDGDVVWLSQDTEAHHWPFTVDECWWAGTVPETDVECVRVPGVRGHPAQRRNTTKAASVGKG